jgi:hypothetical protein
MAQTEGDGRTPEDVLLDQAFEVLLRLIERHLENERKDDGSSQPTEAE